MKRILLLSLILLITPSIMAQDVRKLIDGMSRKEKIAQLVIIEIFSGRDEKAIASELELAKQGLGGLIVQDDDLKKSMELINHLQTGAKIPMIVSIDGEWGASMRYREFSMFPRQMQLGALTSPDLVYAMGNAVGQELRDLKIFVNYAPVVDINNNPSNPVINTRSFGEDREKVARFGRAYMEGMRDAGVAGSAKHFPGHGDTDVDSHKGLPILTFDRARLDSLELYPFRDQIAAGVDMVMIGHLSVPALDPTGTPASISKPIVTDLLRKEMGYDGIIITDALQMKGVATDYADASLAAYKAGADILLMPLDAAATIRDLDAAFERGELDETDLDRRVERVLLLKKRCGMLDPNYSPYVDITNLPKYTNRPMTDFLIQSISDRTMTVIKGLKRIPFRVKNNVAYVAFNATSKESQAMYEELCVHGKIPRFDLPYDATEAQIDSVGKLLRPYRKVIVGIHSGRPVKSSGGYKRFAKITSQQLEWIGKWSRKHRLFGCYMGNPYDLNKLPEYDMFDTFIIGYHDNKYNNKAAARAVLVGGADGVLPVTAGPFGYGFRALE